MAPSPTPSKPGDAPPRGLAIDLRRALYLAYKYELGCPGESSCSMYASRQEAACQSCPKHLKPTEDPPDPNTNRRVALVTRVERMIAAGCRFDADDLPMRLWDELGMLKAERNRFERILFEARTEGRRQEAVTAKAQQDARKLDGLPDPGQSIFKKGGSVGGTPRGRRR